MSILREHQIPNLESGARNILIFDNVENVFDTILEMMEDATQRLGLRKRRTLKEFVGRAFKKPHKTL